MAWPHGSPSLLRMPVSTSSRKPSRARPNKPPAGSAAPPSPIVPSGEAVGQDWVKENFPPQAKQNMEQLVAALEKALAADIQSLPWMTDDTKKQAEAKLDAFRQKIGYPDKWRDYSKFAVTRANFVEDLDHSSEFQFNYELNKVGKPVDEKEWGMTPPTVNAYYNPPQNDINFPAGILQPPFYEFSKDPAVNFGGIGVVIGHEMTHGFDDEGSKYDGQGNVKPWWTDADRTAFDQRLKCEIDEYVKLRARSWRPSQRQAHPRRKYCRQRRHPHRLAGLARHPRPAGQEHRRKNRRLYRSPALLHLLRADLVRESH